MEADDRDSIYVEDETLRAGFTSWPNLLWGLKHRQPDGSYVPISPGAKITYLALLSYAWQKGSCFPGQARLADDIGCGVSTLRVYLRELKETGLVIVKQRGLQRTNLYIIPKLSAQSPKFSGDR